MLEDDFTYVIRKAFKGLALAPGEAALRAGIAENEVLSFSRGRFSEEVARKLAPVLGLHPEALAAHDRYHPTDLDFKEVSRLDLPFTSEQVNAWLIHAGEISLLFDTGNDPRSCLDALRNLGVGDPDQVLITHGHGDHIGGMVSFLDKNIPVRGPSIRGASPVKAGDEFHFGSLKIRACDLSGHFTPAVGYHIHGLDRPILVTGDALFAGSMGGCDGPERYQHALQRLRDVLSPLPGETVILPGHGPATTLEEERSGNPFL